MKLLVVANCQGRSIRQILEAGGDHNAEHVVVHTIDASRMTGGYLAGFDAVVAQDIRPDRSDLWNRVDGHPRLVRVPALVFNGLTPDQMVVQPLPSAPQGAWGNVSRIMLAAWKRGLSQEETRRLFNPEFIDAMGYRRDFATHRQLFLETLSRYTPRAEYLFGKWFDRGVFFHSGHHPKSFVVEDILRDVLEPLGIALPAAPVSDHLPDPLEREAANPNLNHPAARNLLDRPDHVYKRGDHVLPLEAMIARTFRQLDAADGHLRINDRDLERFDTAHAAWAGRAPEPLHNPYMRRPPHAFWSRAVARPAPQDVRPGPRITPVIGRDTRVATAGSCFAQHVARAMVADGLNYYVAEPAPEGMSGETAQARGYGLFSARYGNIYSTRQLLQLIQRAYGTFAPVETAWEVEGGFIDPFRPNIGESFETVAALEAARAEHLAKVRRMFETLDVFVFTLGLTEGWTDRRDGAAYPVTPGAVTKSADPANFAFLNLGHAAVKADLIAFLGELLRVNPKARVIFTVSPVPLIATYGDQDVLSATTYSKSVLRAAAEEVAALFDSTQYFPSYEIITGAFNQGTYFEKDLRSIRPEGVAHAMDVFRQRLVKGAAAEATAPTPDPHHSRDDIADEITRQMFVVCDEELQVRNM